jgi:hypothetical protein
MFENGQQVKVIGRNYSAGANMVGKTVTLVRIYSATYSYDNYYGTLWEVEYNGAKEYVYEADLQLINNNITMEKIYRALKDTPQFTAGAILIKKEGDSSYKLTDDIWNTETENETLKKYLCSGISFAPELVENSPEWYERVYSVKSIKGMYYVAKDKMKELLSKGVVDSGEEEKK